MTLDCEIYWEEISVEIDEADSQLLSMLAHLICRWDPPNKFASHAAKVAEARKRLPVSRIAKQWRGPMSVVPA